MYEITPQKTNRRAHYISAILLIAAFISMFASNLPNLPYRSVMQFSALVMLSVSVLMIIKYTLSSYSYAIIKDGDGYDLTVSELKRRSNITVCRIALDGIEQITLASRSDKDLCTKLTEASKGTKTYNYTVDLAPAEYIHLITNECGERITIKLSYDKRLFEILEGYRSEKNQVNTDI